MKYIKIINRKKKIYKVLLKYLENQEESTMKSSFHKLVKIIELQKIKSHPPELREFLRIISIISKNHHRFVGFIEKIEKILFLLSNTIKDSLDNTCIFNIFKSNRRILLSLFEMEIIKQDKSIFQEELFTVYFYPEIQKVVEKEKFNTINEQYLKFDPKTFEEKRKIGENDSYICELIRNDSVEEFIQFVNRSNINIHKMKIEPSIFETNSFLMKKTPKLNEYAAFYGSIQIIQYLNYNNVELTPSIWIYAIHSQNAEFFHFLEELKIKQPNNSYEKCLKESIKCHHNDFANYIINNLMNHNNIMRNTDQKVFENIYYYGCRYHNYLYFPRHIHQKYTFFYLCKFNYYRLVKFCLKSKKIKVNKKIVLIKLLIKIFR
ncbi:hypothetical protein M9Y10_000201 [Tritrichomonas musculus]|uniref:DUF3447 domain-containing protein n=1 Tax=Tritrichomonas musculus TaxID=1915356 RepID=A0ABR2L435_9EUKA